MKKLLSHRHGAVVLFVVLFVSVAFATRLALLLKSHAVVDWSLKGLIGVFAFGFAYDVVAASYFAIPVVLYLTLLPEKIFRLRFHRALTLVFFFAVLYVLLFGATAEWLFWDEFGVRFNFIAVDYLVYTTEVLGNIRESYPLPYIFSGLFLLSLLVFFGIYRTGWFNTWFEARTSWRSRVGWGGVMLLLPLAFTFAVDNRMVPAFGNRYNQELARDGEYSLLAAFRNNELDYDSFYRTIDTRVAFARLRQLLKTDNATYLSDDPTDITRQITNEGEEKRYNVIQITVESLSAVFLGAFGNTNNLTPNLDALAAQGILFTDFYATGNRTDRGMEAMTLSVPPTPGRSIVKRPGNEQLFSIGSIFQARGYDTAFIYSGFGYFDNMNYFFGHNGYKVIDRTVMPKEAITFANVWGACDEDLFNWVLQEADRSYAAGKPFLHFVMTTSNHRPFTYPNGRIDIPSHSGRDGAVKYTDYAIGKFIRDAEAKPWFSNTVFAIVADHCASSAGRTHLPIKNYEIPLIIYNPHLFQPRKVDMLCSQVDFAPTLLGLLHWSYKSRFFGKDVFRLKPDDECAFIGNYEELGYMTLHRLAVLRPVREQAIYDFVRKTGQLTPAARDVEMTRDAIAYYQTAQYLFHHRLQTISDDR